MASERQIAANRRNARNSSGPRTASGKKRASQNAYRHGLTKPVSSAEFAREVELLARQIAGDCDDQITIELARDAAAAELELVRVRAVKVALIERVTAFGRFDALPEMPAQEPQRTAEAVRRALPDLLKLNRYESRAVTRRDRAIRTITLRSKVL